MRILAIEHETPEAAPDQFRLHSKAEALRVWQLYQAGVIREPYFRQDRSSAVLVLECADLDEAAGVLETLPMVSEGLITFELIPLVAYPGFERLFG